MSESDKRLRFFGYSLTGKVRDWLDVLPETYQVLLYRFLMMFSSIESFTLYVLDDVL